MEFNWQQSMVENIIIISDLVSNTGHKVPTFCGAKISVDGMHARKGDSNWEKNIAHAL